MRLNRSLYGLKHASRSWHRHLVTRLKSLSFEQSLAGPCAFRLIEGVRGGRILRLTYMQACHPLSLPTNKPNVSAIQRHYYQYRKYMCLLLLDPTFQWHVVGRGRGWSSQVHRCFRHSREDTIIFLQSVFSRFLRQLKCCQRDGVRAA